MPSEMLRVSDMSDAERAIIGLLTPAERKDILLAAAQSKQRRLNKELLREHVQRVLRGEVAIQTNTEDGYPYPTNGRMCCERDQNVPMEDIGRVPGHTGIHVLRKSDGSLKAVNGFGLRKQGEPWIDPLAPLDDEEA